MSDLAQDTVDDLRFIQEKIARVTDPESSDALDVVCQCLTSIHQRLLRVEAEMKS